MARKLMSPLVLILLLASMPFLSVSHVINQPVERGLIAAARDLELSYPTVTSPSPRHEVGLSLRPAQDIETVHKRGLFSWAVTRFFTHPLATTANLASIGCQIADGFGAITSNTGKAACGVLNGIAGLSAMASGVGAKLANQIGETYGMDWLQNLAGKFGASSQALLSSSSSNSSMILRRALDLELSQYNLTAEQVQLAHAYNRYRLEHQDTGDMVLPHHYNNATKENPLRVTTAGTHTIPINMTVWKQHNDQLGKETLIHSWKHPSATYPQKRDVCWQIDLGKNFCTDNTDNNSNDPDEWFYEMDIYGSTNDMQAVMNDIGDTGQYSSNNAADGNGFSSLAQEWGNELADENAWWECTCVQANGNWVLTGDLQATWNDGKENGYQPCWNSNCDGS